MGCDPPRHAVFETGVDHIGRHISLLISRNDE